MVRSRSGFMVVDVVVVLNVVAILAMLAMPTPPPSQSSSNEVAAITILKHLAQGQHVFKKGVFIDEDIDGVGEYGSIGELAGVSLLMRHYVGVGWPLAPPLLPAAFQTIDVNGIATSSGYHYVLYLPNLSTNPAGLRDIAGGGPHPWVDPNHCEAFWCAYAWPVSLGVTGKRAFFVNQSGVVLQTYMGSLQYSGANPAAGPQYSAAYSYTGMNQPVALPPVQGFDGNDWDLVP